MSNKRSSTIYLEKVIGIAIFAAMAVIVAYFCSPVKVQGFLSLDLKDAVIAIAAFIYGPISGVIIALIAALIECFTFSTTEWYGLIMNFASSAVFTLVAALIYKKFRSVNGVIIAFTAAIISTTGVMLLLNTFVTPIYLVTMMGIPTKEIAVQTVVDMLPTVLLPFNFAKSLLNASLAIMLYKPILTALSKAKIVKTKAASLNFNKNTKFVLAVGAECLVVAVAIFLIIA